jgi:cysteine desulfurase
MKRIIYADNAATTKLDIDAFDAMKPYLLDEYGNASQPYSFSRSPKKALQEARQIIASCINAEPEEIYFTSGGTESDNRAIKGVAFASQQRRNIVTTAFEHHAVLRACASMEEQGHSVAYINPDLNGFITATALEAIVSSETMLVSVMMSNNEIGTIQPIQQLAQIAHNSGALFHTDAVQCVGHIPIDVKGLDVDMLSASAHKFNGPKGIGFLYIKNGTPIEALLNGGAQEKGYRAGTENVAAIVGMAVALKKNCRDMEAVSAHISHLEGTLIDSLNSAGISYIRNGSGNLMPGNMSLSFPGFEGEAILHRLDLMGIQVSTGSACDSENTQISHVLRAIGATEQIALGTIRISLGRDNTIDDIYAISSAICKIIK